MGSAIEPQNRELRLSPPSVTASCLRLVDFFAAQDYIRNFHLVGGTALAVQLEHRLSEDLDFFNLNQFDATGWRLPPASEVVKQGENYLRGEAGGAKFDFVLFAYPPHYPLINWRGLKLLDARDIALFKLFALTGRNRKKDIVDLYFIDKEVKPLAEVVKDFFSKYARGDVNLLKQVETLFNDEVVATTQMPVMLKTVDWDTAYREVKQKLLEAIRSEIGLQ